MPGGTKQRPGPDTLTYAVAEKLYLLIKQRRLTQEHIAADVGMSPAQLSGFLNHTKHIDIEQLDAICRILGLNIAEEISNAERDTNLRRLVD